MRRILIRGQGGSRLCSVFWVRSNTETRINGTTSTGQKAKYL
jgi:hypothetical protein